MYPFDFILERWRARQRKLDLEILWPVLRDATPDRALARETFRLHASQEMCWRCLSNAEREQILGRELV